MGAKLGRRFLKQPAEKLKAVFVALLYGYPFSVLLRMTIQLWRG